MTRKRPRPTRLPRWQEQSVYWSLGLLIASGIAWLALDTWVRVEGEFGPEHHPAEHWLLIAHGVLAYAFLIVAGTVIPVHIKSGWAQRRNRKSGLSLGLSSAIAAATALGLYYAADEALRPLVSAIHWLVGLVILPALLIHAIRGRRGS